MAGLVITDLSVNAEPQIIRQDDGSVAVGMAEFHTVTLEVMVFGAESPATAAAFIENGLRLALVTEGVTGNGPDPQ